MSTSVIHTSVYGTYYTRYCHVSSIHHLYDMQHVLALGPGFRPIFIHSFNTYSINTEEEFERVRSCMPTLLPNTGQARMYVHEGLDLGAPKQSVSGILGVTHRHMPSSKVRGAITQAAPPPASVGTEYQAGQGG